MPHAKPRGRVLVGRGTIASPPDAPQVALDYLNSPARLYVNDALLTNGGDLAAALAEGRAAFERDLAESGEAWITDTDHELGAMHRGSVVYYMRMDQIVKIGTSVNLVGRLAAINPQGVMAVEWGGVPLERQRHREFADLHVHGEWFHLRDQLVDHIIALRADFETRENVSTERWLQIVGALA